DAAETRVDADVTREPPGPAPEHLVDERLLHDREPEPAVLRPDRQAKEPELARFLEHALGNPVLPVDLLPDGIDDFLHEVAYRLAKLPILVAQAEIHVSLVIGRAPTPAERPERGERPESGPLPIRDAALQAEPAQITANHGEALIARAPTRYKAAGAAAGHE